MWIFYLLAIPLLIYLGIYFAVWAVVLYVLVKTFRPRALSSERFRIFVYFPVIGIVAWYPIWDLFPGTLLVRWTCERYGGLHTYVATPIQALGYVYEGDPVPTRPSWGRVLNDATVKRIGKQLIESKLAFVELKNVESTRTGGSSDYYQNFYLDKTGAANCLKPGPYRLTREALEPLDGRCLAVSRADKPKAPIVVTRDLGYRTFFPTSISWDRHAFIETRSKTLLAEHKRFEYHLFWGLLNTGATCPSKATGFDILTSDLVKGP